MKKKRTKHRFFFNQKLQMTFSIDSASEASAVRRSKKPRIAGAMEKLMEELSRYVNEEIFTGEVYFNLKPVGAPELIITWTRR